MAIKGIDVSQFQGQINWDAVKNDVQFAIIRAGYGGGGIDGQFAHNWAEAKRVGLPKQAYFFAYPGRSTGSQQAHDFISIVKSLDPGDSLSLDMEDEPVYGRSLVASDVQWAKEFCDTVLQLTGVKPLIYLNTSLKSRFDWSSLKEADYGLWQANYGVNNGQPNTEPSPAPWDFNALWQYSSQGSFGGIHPVDSNIFNGSVEDFLKYGAAGQVNPTPTPSPTPPQPAPPTSNGLYSVVAGDTLSGIAAKFGATWQALAASNGLSNPNLIYPGQMLKVPGSATQKTYTVESGDTLSAIAAKFGTTWQHLAAINGIGNPNLIFPGQVLKIA